MLQLSVFGIFTASASHWKRCQWKGQGANGLGFASLHDQSRRRRMEVTLLSASPPPGIPIVSPVEESGGRQAHTAPRDGPCNATVQPDRRKALWNLVFQKGETSD
jgi:hypothetical protein